MLDVGHSHPDFTYPNDPLLAEWTLVLIGLAAIVSCVMIVAAVLS